MIKEIEVNIQETSADGETLYFKLSDTATGKTYELRYCHRTDNPWYSQWLLKCYFGELYCKGKDLGVAFMLSVGRRHTLSFKVDNM